MVEENKIAVSVTIPIYNTEKYLYKCLESLSKQSFNNIEFILINDGSTDKSLEICQKQVKIDDRYKLINQKNFGSAVARQNGLNVAKGEYIIVCDSDDWVEPQMYETLYQKAIETDADIVCCGYYAEYDDGRSIAKQTIFKEYNGFVDNYDFVLRSAGSSWIKLIKKSLFNRTGASYIPGINLGEDAMIIYKLMKGNPKIVQIEGHYYHYRRQYKRTTYTNMMKMSQIHQLRYIYEWLKDNYQEDRYESLRFHRALDLAFATLRTIDFDKDYLTDFLTKELPFPRFINNDISAKSLLVMTEKYLSIDFARLILKLFYKQIYR